MKNPIERLLYVTLVLVFLGLGLALYVVALVIHGQADQLKKIESLNQAQDRTISEIRATQVNIKADNQRNAQVIICMLQVPVAQRTPDLERNCRSQVATQITQSSQATPKPAPTPAPVASSQPSPQSSPHPTPQPSSQPSPRPTPTQRILNFVRGLL